MLLGVETLCQQSATRHASAGVGTGVEGLAPRLKEYWATIMALLPFAFGMSELTAE